MVKKLQKMAAKNKPGIANPFGGVLPASLLDSQFAQSVKDSAQHIWAAGLGAFAKAQGEGGKVVETLVKEGLNLQKKTQSVAEGKIGAMADKMSGMAGDVGSKAGQQWDKLESIFEERVARALNRLGVPSAKDVAEMAASIEALNAAVGIKPVARKSPATKAAEVQPAAKVATRKTRSKVAAVAPVAAKPAVNVPAQAIFKPVAKPVVKPAVNVPAQAIFKPVAKPAAKPAVKAESKVSSKPAKALDASPAEFPVAKTVVKRAPRKTTVAPVAAAEPAAEA